MIAIKSNPAFTAVASWRMDVWTHTIVPNRDLLSFCGAHDHRINKSGIIIITTITGKSSMTMGQTLDEISLPADGPSPVIYGPNSYDGRVYAMLRSPMFQPVPVTRELNNLPTTDRLWHSVCVWKNPEEKHYWRIVKDSLVWQNTYCTK